MHFLPRSTLLTSYQEFLVSLIHIHLHTRQKVSKTSHKISCIIKNFPPDTVSVDPGFPCTASADNSLTQGITRIQRSKVREVSPDL